MKISSPTFLLPPGYHHHPVLLRVLTVFPSPRVLCFNILQASSVRFSPPTPMAIWVSKQNKTKQNKTKKRQQPKKPHVHSESLSSISSVTCLNLSALPLSSFPVLCIKALGASEKPKSL
ncbi:unnamed protein product [Gulo gulo]|uniref:Uncharacterized protein n=1 Tax=Gulo gulo TaxID=48420 RepID=A0A9X9Q679_GULGU|nr:unnamed protein product [Gulo gulo]